MVSVKIRGKKEQIDLEEEFGKDKVKVVDILKKFGVTPDTCIVTLNGETVTEDEVVTDGDEVEIIVAISGGVF